MSSSLAAKWTVCDRAFQLMRFSRVFPFLPDDGVLVDLGCGSGAFLRGVRQRIRLGYGCDTVVPEDDGNLSFRAANLNGPLPFEDECADTVVALAVLEHLDNPHQFVAEAFRILRPGGTFVLTTPSPAAKPVLDFLARFRLISPEDIADHKHYFTQDELHALFDKSGFGYVVVSPFQLGFNAMLVTLKRRGQP